MGRVFQADFKQKTWHEIRQISQAEVDKQELAERQSSVDEIHEMAQQACDLGYDLTRAILIIPVGDEDNSIAVAEMMGYADSGDPVETLKRAAARLGERIEAEADEEIDADEPQ